MNKQNTLGKKVGLASMVMVGALVFSVEKANAGFFDKLNESLDGVNASLDKAQNKVDETQAKLDETKADVDKTKAKLDATKQKGESMVDDAKKGLASLSED